MKTDPKYPWINNLKGLPKTIQIGMELLGTTEVIGKGSSKTILAWRDELNGAAPAGKPIVSGYSSDDIPWCGLYAAIVIYLRKKVVGEVVKLPLWAKSWAKYGTKSPEASLGDVLVFERPGGGGHVGFYIAEDATTYHVLGGNQSDKVCITRIAKARCIAMRRPIYNAKPASVKPYSVAAAGALSGNEA